MPVVNPNPKVLCPELLWHRRNVALLYIPPVQGVSHILIAAPRCLHIMQIHPFLVSGSVSCFTFRNQHINTEGGHRTVTAAAVCARPNSKLRDRSKCRKPVGSICRARVMRFKPCLFDYFERYIRGWICVVLHWKLTCGNSGSTQVCVLGSGSFKWLLCLLSMCISGIVSCLPLGSLTYWHILFEFYSIYLHGCDAKQFHIAESYTSTQIPKKLRCCVMNHYNCQIWGLWN